MQNSIFWGFEYLNSTELFMYLLEVGYLRLGPRITVIEFGADDRGSNVAAVLQSR